MVGLTGPGLECAASQARRLGLPLLTWSVLRIRLAGERRTIGCLAPGGVELWNHDLLRLQGLCLADLAEEIARLYEVMRRQQRLLQRQNPCQPCGRHLIVAAAGIGNGLAIRAALQSLRRLEPASITLATPLGAEADSAASAARALSQPELLLPPGLASDRAAPMALESPTAGGVGWRPSPWAVATTATNNQTSRLREPG